MSVRFRNENNNMGSHQTRSDPNFCFLKGFMLLSLLIMFCLAKNWIGVGRKMTISGKQLPVRIALDTL